MGMKEKFTGFVESKVMPFVGVVSTNKILLAIRDGLVLSMPVMIVGSIAIVIGDFPVKAVQDFFAMVFGENWNWWNWDVINPATMGLVALFTACGVGYSYAKSHEVEPLPAGILGIVAYFLLLVQMDGGGFAADDFGQRGCLRLSSAAS